jgi:antitoxin HigA-1
MRSSSPWSYRSRPPRRRSASPGATLSTLLDERASLSPEMALRIEKAFGVSMDTLMRMQNSYDIARTRARADEIKVPPFGGATPMKQAVGA